MEERTLHLYARERKVEPPYQGGTVFQFGADATTACGRAIEGHVDDSTVRAGDVGERRRAAIQWPSGWDERARGEGGRRGVIATGQQDMNGPRRDKRRSLCRALTRTREAQVSHHLRIASRWNAYGKCLWYIVVRLVLSAQYLQSPYRQW